MKLLIQIFFQNRITFPILLCLSMLLSNTYNIYAQSGYVGETIHLSAPSVPGTIGGAAWYCTDKSDYVTVSGNAYGGTAQITCYFSGTATIACQYAYTYYIGTKKEYGNGTVYYTISCKPSQVTLNKREITLKPGQEFDLAYTNQSGFTLPFVVWTTSDKNIANFGGEERQLSSKEVTVRAVNVGQCIITCDGHSGTDAPTCVVTVKADPPTGISVAPERLTLQEGKTGYFTYELSPSDAYSNVTWSSSNTSVATVTEDGQVTAVSEGTAQITATTDNGLTAYGTVEVTPLPRQISLVSTMQTTIGYTFILEPTITPANAITICTWETTDAKVATVDATGRVKGKTAGTTTISVTTENGKTASCRVTVKTPSEGMDHRNAEVRTNALKNLIRKSLNNIK